jgi:hypothetical protein
MQTTGEQNYWKSPDSSDEEAVSQPSQFAGYDMDDSEEVPQEMHRQFEPLSWQASEYVHTEKNILWFVILGLVTLVIAAVAYFLIRSWSFTLLVFVMAATAGFYAKRPPHALNYTLDDDFLVIEEKKYAYEEFKAFAILKDGPLAYIMLIPVKRFMPAVTLYFPPEDGKHIVDILGSIMPLQEREPDMLERAVRKLRF